mgnify:CR=1 FL=1
MGLPLYPAFSVLSSPHPPFPSGEGGSPKDYFAGGFAPGTPALNRLRHLQFLPCGHPAQGACGAAQNRQKRFPMSSAGSQGEGGPGERNYPSHATAAFEMVLSPGAGRTSAARGTIPCPPQGTAAAGQAGDKEGKPHLRVPLTPRRAGAAQGHAPPAPHRAPPLFCHRPPPIKNTGKVLGGLGASFKKPPTHLCPRRL